MKRKVETTHQVEAKIPSLSSFLKEENLDVDEIEKDVDQFLDCYNEFVKYTTEILDKKEKVNPTKVAPIIIKFKELNRKTQFRLNISREKTKETKDGINKNHLVMQNLLYEALHLEKETNSCLEFKSLHEDIELVPLDEFHQSADESLKTYTSDHELTLNRLHWELIQRKNLSAQITQTEEMEQQLFIEINKKRQAYTEISAHLKSVFDTTRPLENIFDLPMHHQEEQNELVESLPESLYVLYLQMRIQADLDGQNMSVELVKENHTVRVVVKLMVDSVALVLTFQWNASLELVTVLPTLSPAVTKDLTHLSRCLLESSTLLSELPGETGCPMQSPWIRAKLGQRGETTISGHNGLPYLWCQRITGAFSDLPVHERSPSTTEVPMEYQSSSQSAQRVSPTRPLTTLIRDIQERLRSRLKLAADIDRLSTAKNSAPAISTIANWSISNFTQFKKTTKETGVFVNCGLANEQCFYFAAVVRSIRYPDDEIPLWLVVPHSYPESNTPLVILNKSCLKLPGQDMIGDLASVIHLLEVEVNCYCDEFPSDILNCQISRLLLGTDILLDYLHGGCSDNKISQILLGNKYPVSKRPFRNH